MADFPPGNDGLLTRSQAAEYLGLKPQTLALWFATNRYDLPVVKVGRNIVRYRRSDLERFLEQRTVNGDSTKPAQQQSENPNP